MGGGAIRRWWAGIVTLSFLLPLNVPFLKYFGLLAPSLVQPNDKSSSPFVCLSVRPSVHSSSDYSQPSSPSVSCLLEAELRPLQAEEHKEAPNEETMRRSWSRRR